MSPVSLEQAEAARSPVAPVGRTSSLEADAHRLALFLERRRIAVLAVLTLVYLVSTIHQARSKPLWYDEVLTVVAAGAPDIATVWQTPSRIGDVTPPLFHVLVHFTTRWVENIEIGARIPSIVGYWIFCLCLYRFTHRRAGIYFALTAFLIPIVSNAYDYAVEARSYALMLGFCGIALVGWQAAADGTRRAVGAVALAFGLGGAILCHFYGVLIYLPLAGAEAFRTWRTRRLTWRIWAAFAAGGLPLLWMAASISAAGKWTTHFWSKPSPVQVFEFWQQGFIRSLTFLVLMLAMLALSIVKTGHRPSPNPGIPVKLEFHELIAGVLFLALPVVGVAGGLWITHAFTGRYALCAVAGLGFLAPMVAAHFSRGSAAAGLQILAALLCALGLLAISNPSFQNPFGANPILAKAARTEPVVVSDGLMFLQLWQYAPADLKPALQFVADRDAAVKYFDYDTIDAGLSLLRSQAPVNVVDYRSFAAPGKEFLLYYNTRRPQWLLSKILDEGGSAQLVASQEGRQMLRVRFRQ